VPFFLVLHQILSIIEFIRTHVAVPVREMIQSFAVSQYCPFALESPLTGMALELMHCDCSQQTVQLQEFTGVLNASVVSFSR
jgi:hypothetical protein